MSSPLAKTLKAIKMQILKWPHVLTKRQWHAALGMRSCGRHGSELLRSPFRREPDMRTEMSGRCLIHCRVHSEDINPRGCPGQRLSTAGALQPGHSCPVWASDLCSLTYGLRLSQSCSTVWDSSYAGSLSFLSLFTAVRPASRSEPPSNYFCYFSPLSFTGVSSSVLACAS